MNAFPLAESKKGQQPCMPQWLGKCIQAPKDWKHLMKPSGCNSSGIGYGEPFQFSNQLHPVNVLRERLNKTRRTGGGKISLMICHAVKEITSSFLRFRDFSGVQRRLKKRLHSHPEFWIKAEVLSHRISSCVTAAEYMPCTKKVLGSNPGIFNWKEWHHIST